MKPRSLLPASALLLFCVLALGWRVVHLRAATYTHPDEVITMKVVDRVIGARSLDTNWKHAGLPGVFDQPQYNFSGYLLFVAGVEAVARGTLGAREEGALRRVRLISALFWALGIGLAALVAQRLAGWTGAFVTAALVAVTPSLFLDSLYARPEALFSAAALAVLLIHLRSSPPGRPAIVAMSLIVGYLVSIKVSAAVFGLLPLAACARAPARGAALYGLAIGAAVVGFALGAPAALLHPREFLAGISFLSQQYGTSHWPHGLGHEASVLERLGHAIRWLWQAWSWSWLLVGAGLAALWRARDDAPLVGFAPFMATLLFFGATPVFFERNLSPAMAALSCVAGVGAAALWRIVVDRAGPLAAGVTLAIMLALAMAAPFDLTRHVTKALRDPPRLAAIRAELSQATGRPVVPAGWLVPGHPSTTGFLAGACAGEIVELHHAGDAAGYAWTGSLARDGRWELVRELRSRFEGRQASTLHTYLSPAVQWLRASGSGRPPCR